MKKLIYKATFLALAGMIVNCAVWGQEQDLAHVEVALTYDSARANLTTGYEFWMQGGSAQAQARLWRGFSVVADLAGLHTGDINRPGAGLDLITATFGPRYTRAVFNRRVVVFGHVLTGEAHGMNGQFPFSTTLNSSADSLALQIGGGVNLHLTPRFSLRAFDANWLRTQLPNATTNVQNNLRLGAGIVCRFK